MATTTLSNKVLQAAFAYEDTGVAASGTFTANDDAVVGIAGTVTGVGGFAATIGEAAAYTLTPTDPDDAADLAAAAVAIVAAINEELNPTPPSDGDGGDGGVDGDDGES